MGTQFPQATHALLETLRPAHDSMFPSHDVQARPDTADEDTAEGRTRLAQSVALIRAVSGGWLRSLEGDEGKNGVQTHSDSSALAKLPELVRRQLQYLREKPGALLYRPRPASSNMLDANPSTIAGANLADIPAGEEDLATFLFPRILRAASSLEGALLTSEMPVSDSTTAAAHLWKSRREARNELEELLVTVVVSLSESAIRVEWRGAKPPVQGGVGKAREMMDEMIKLLAALILFTQKSPLPYPHTHVFETISQHHKRSAVPATADPFNATVSSLTVKSPLHARALIIVTLRIIMSIITRSPFLQDFFPAAVDILAESWPVRIETRKGKERSDEVHSRILAATLELSAGVLGSKHDTFTSAALEVLAPKISLELGNRFAYCRSADEIDMEDSLSSSEARIDRSLATIVAKFWTEMVAAEQDGGRIRLRQVLSFFIQQEGVRIVDCLIEDASSETRLSSLILLAIPLVARFETIFLPAYSLLTPECLYRLASFTSGHPILPFVTPLDSNALQDVAITAWKVLRAAHDLHEVLPDIAVGTQSLAKKRKRADVNETSGAESEMSQDGGIGKQTEIWRASVKQVLPYYLPGREFDIEHGLEKVLISLIKDLRSAPQDQILNTLKVIGLWGCAKNGTLSFATPSIHNTSSPQPACKSCDVSSGSPLEESEVPSKSRLLTFDPLQRMCTVASSWLDRNLEVKFRIAFLKAIARLLRHTETSTAALSKFLLVDIVSQEMQASSRSLRIAAGNVLVAIVQANQVTAGAIDLIAHLFNQLDQCLSQKPEQPAVVESVLTTIGKIARLSAPQSQLECECLVRLVTRLGHPNTYLRSFARTQLEELAIYRDVKTYALVNPHFAILSPLLINADKSSQVTLAAAAECFRQSTASLLAATREHTLPPLVLSNNLDMMKKIASASEKSIPEILYASASGVIAFLLMQSREECDTGLRVFMGLMKSLEGSQMLSLPDILASIKVPLVYKLVLELGDEQEEVFNRAVRALQTLARLCRSPSDRKEVDLSIVLKESIVGVLSLMNRGLDKPTGQKPSRENQRIIRALEAVTAKVGHGIAGFSPQIMATLQSAIEVKDLRAVTLQAYFQFVNSLKFQEIGPYIGTISATFLRLWPEFTTDEREKAVGTLNYIILENSDGLSKFVQDVADLGGIEELAQADKRLSEIRKYWTFDVRVDHLLVRIGNENDIVAVQALKELRQLLKGNTDLLQALSAGNSFDPKAGSLIKVLFGAAAKDGAENGILRNIAFECIGILGALDPDRFEIPQAAAPMIVFNNFHDSPESIAFALHLIQNLLIGAYRSTNDTKHQEFLAYAIQELLSFCGFKVGLVLPSSSTTKDQQIDEVVRKRWNNLPKAVLETCSPLLGGSFSFKEREVARSATEYPIYSTTSSYRDWIRFWANDLITRLKAGSVTKSIFKAFPPILHLEDISVAQHLLPHLVLNSCLSGNQVDRDRVNQEITAVLTDQVSHTSSLSANSRMLSAQTVFDLMDHLSRWTTLAKKKQQDLAAERKRKGKNFASTWNMEASLIDVEGLLTEIPHVLVGQAAFTCKAYARSLLNFESHVTAERTRNSDDNLQVYYENLHECYADLDEPDGMEGISTKIISPSVLHQIREHESTGRWTSAQSCWEVMLQKEPDEPANHLGLLRCLRNLGHYDSMRTHIVGIMHGRSELADWDRILAPFTIEASLIIGDWTAVEDALSIPGIAGPEISLGKVITAIRGQSDEIISAAFYEAREELGSPIVAAGKDSYRRVHDSVIHLHILHELDVIRQSVLRASGGSRNHSSTTVSERSAALLNTSLTARLESSSPSFRARESILNMRRTAYRLEPPRAPALANTKPIGQLWIETAKIARKAGHSQTAYSAILQAQELEAAFVFVQSAKLLKTSDQTYKAIQAIDTALKPLIPSGFGKTPKEPSDLSKFSQKGCPSSLAKASLRRARWLYEAGRLDHEQIIYNFQESSRLAPEWESPHYYLGHYWDEIYEKIDNKSGLLGLTERSQTCHHYLQALLHGNKFIYQAMPRMLTLWFEIAEHPKVLEVHKDKKATRKNGGDIASEFLAINSTLSKALRRLPSYQWLTVFPQLVSRVLHKNEYLIAVLEQILLKVLVDYPHQAFWGMAGGAKSRTARRAKRVNRIFDRAKAVLASSLHCKVILGDTHIRLLSQITPGGSSASNPAKLIDEGLRLVDSLLALSDYSLANCNTLSMKKTFPALYQSAPTTLMIPLQSQLNVSLPYNSVQHSMHKPFADNMATFKEFDDDVVVMSSLQKPRKISVFGSDGKLYSFLAKPKDDLRKDARLMQFNDMIIKLLKKDSESRSRHLTIRTYSVVPINEECGLIEWVPNVVVLRGILNKLYTRKGIPSWTSEIKKVYEGIRTDPSKTGQIFESEILKKYPPVFHEWFLESFPEPSAWLRARLAYCRTTAVISMVGFVLGLGDRHCENILLEGMTGEAVHVDFNCLFDKGRTFEVSEKVPFRLTTNIVAGMGVTGVEGVYRRSSEITLRILRENKDSLMSVLETFLHDPLVEWKTSKSKDAGGSDIARQARESLEGVSLKLRGLRVTSDPASTGEREVSTGEQVERLIREARNPSNLGSMYVGWCSWF